MNVNPLINQSTTPPFIAFHRSFVHALPEGHRFPMIKYELLPQQLLYENVVEAEDFFAPAPIALHHLSPVHEAKYWKRFIRQDLTRKEIRRIGFPQSKEIIDRELRIAGGTVTAAETALMKTRIGFNIAGGTHHAGKAFGEGFCMLNDQAIAAYYLLGKYKLEKILIVDLDVHQGNGTADIFAKEDRVFTFSMHGANNFPFKKETSDLDVGVEDNISGEEYLTILDQTLSRLFEEVAPEFVFFQAGVDVLQTDKMGRMKLNKEDCRQRDGLVFQYCQKYNTPVQVSMGGGYSEQIRNIVDAHCNTYKEGILAMTL